MGSSAMSGRVGTVRCSVWFKWRRWNASCCEKAGFGVVLVGIDGIYVVSHCLKDTVLSKQSKYTS